MGLRLAKPRRAPLALAFPGPAVDARDKRRGDAPPMVSLALPLMTNKATMKEPRTRRLICHSSRKPVSVANPRYAVRSMATASHFR